MTTDPGSDPRSAFAAVHEPARRSGSILLVLLVAGAVVATAVGFMALGRSQAQPYILGLLAVLAMVGLFTRGKPVYRIEDLRSLRLRIISAGDLNLLDAWQVHGVRVAWEEVAQALQTGMVDAYLNPPIVAVMFGHGNVLDYFTDLRMGPSARCIVASHRWYEHLEPRDGAAFDAGVREARAANRAWTRAAIPRERAMLEKTGIKWLDIDPAARDEWRALTRRMKRTRWESPAAEARLKAMIDATRDPRSTGAAP